MVNPDGVIIGNYRTSYSGNDLNRKYHNPDPRLHPTIFGIKGLVAELVNKTQNIKTNKGTTIPPRGQQEIQNENEEKKEQEIFAFIDMHGHSRKKNVFIYGPYFPLHSERYFKMRIIPKLISEET